MRQKKSSNKVYYPYRDKRNAIQALKMLSKNKFLSTNQISEGLNKKWGYPQNRTIQTLRRLKELDYCEEYGLLANPKHECDNCNKSTWYLVTRELLELAKTILEKNKDGRKNAQETDPEGFDKTKWFDCSEGHVLGRLIFLQCFECKKDVAPHNDEEYKIKDDHYWSLSNNGLFVMLSILNGNILHAFINSHSYEKILGLADILIKSHKKERVERLCEHIKQRLKIDPDVTTVANSWFKDERNKVFSLKFDKDQYPLLVKYQEKYFSEYLQQRISDAKNG